MRHLPPDFAAHLAEGATTLCHCWTLTRRDGVVLGFTDHDRDIVLDGVLHWAENGLTAAETTTQTGFAVSGGDVAGALVSGALTEADILAGLYDDARVETWRVDWSAPQTRLRIATASVGEIRRADDAFVAELRGGMHRFDETSGLVYRVACSADLGDARCRIDLDDARYRADVVVATTDGALGLQTDGLDAFPDGWFTGGRLVWTEGANAGLPIEVRDHRVEGAAATFALGQRMPAAILAGDRFTVTAGCDKRLATCRAKFGNVVNHRGFPHMPGNDFVLKVAQAGSDVMDGGSLFR